MRRRADGVPLIIADAGAQELQRVQHDDPAFNEGWLQTLIDQHPGLLPIADLEPGFDRLISICTELPTQHGPIDNLLMTATGDIVLVETKLWRNPEARRKVIAQALDYAACLFEMGYAELEHAVLLASFCARPRPARLYDLVTAENPLAEADFVDAVNTNLRRGRIVVLVVGDGIRTEAERLAASLQSHAGFHFTFGLVELAVFRLPAGGLLVQPRTLAKTVMIERGIIQIDDRRALALPPVETSRGETKAGRAANITTEQFYEALAEHNPALPGRLAAFMEAVAPLGVYPDVRRTLNLKWDPPEGKPINLGFILRTGTVSTEATMWSIPREVALLYLQGVADVLGGELSRPAPNGSQYVTIQGKPPTLQHMLDHQEGWIKVIEEFQRVVVDGARDQEP